MKTHTKGPWFYQYRQTVFSIGGGGDELGGDHTVAIINRGAPRKQFPISDGTTIDFFAANQNQTTL